MVNDGNQHQALAAHLKALRTDRNWSLQDLAEASGISRATLSRIENADVSPTAESLGRLASSFGLPLSQLFAPLDPSFKALIRRDEQSIWTDPEGGFSRRILSPPGTPLKIDLIECSLEPHQCIRYERPAFPGHEHHLVLLTGALSIEVDEVAHRLRPGDCLRYRLRGPSVFTTEDDPARYIIAMA